MENLNQVKQPNAHIFQINSSAGGVPKLPSRRGEVGFLGLQGDSHANPDVHGGPEAALCLYSLERILDLQNEGHPIFPGSVGENVTLVGFEWEKLHPGTRLRLGQDVLVEITRYTTPCRTITGSFLDNNSNRIADKFHPGWSRLYARVLQPGVIEVGQPVTIV